MDTNEVHEAPDQPNQDRCERWRNWGGFWCIGLCNNFAYVVMLSAAHDILSRQEAQNYTTPIPPTVIDSEGRNRSSSPYDCNPVSTGAVLLADILPTLLLKVFAPFVIHVLPYGVRVLFCVSTAVVSFLLVSFASAVWMSILGVVFASVSSGLGEVSFLSLTVYFNRSVLSAWSSGTGGAGVAGALLYSGLTQAGLSPRTTLLVMLVVPMWLFFSYFFLLVTPPSLPQWHTGRGCASEFMICSEERQHLINDSDNEGQEEQDTSTKENEKTERLTFTEKLWVVVGLLKFVGPLAVVYFAEYFINQGLMELLYFPNFFLSHEQQYRWYQTLYQVGVLVSRSSLCCLKIRRVWVLSVLQVANAVVLFFAVYRPFLPSAWLVFVIILFEGLLGGAAYVNTFYCISKETGDRQREFALAAASVGDSAGIALAGATAFPVHNYFCSM